MNTASKIFDLIEDGNANDLQDLVQKDSRVAQARNDSGQSPIIFAQYQRRLELAEILRTAQPFTDIGEAAAMGQVERIRQILLLEPELMDLGVYEGLTPLHLAARFGQTDAVELLLELGSSNTATAKNDSGQLAIHCAVQSGSLSTIEALLDHDNQVEAEDKLGRTPAHYAVQAEQLEVLQVLIKYGADPKRTSSNGSSPLELAHGQTRQLLEGFQRVFVSGLQ
jgi:ankyrin repeat protein